MRAQPAEPARQAWLDKSRAGTEGSTQISSETEEFPAEPPKKEEATNGALSRQRRGRHRHPASTLGSTSGVD